MTKYPLFQEIARNSDPVTSHERADSLTKTPRLTKMILLVLKYVDMHPGETARQLGVFMFQYNQIPDNVEWPHKVMLRMVKVGWVRREKHTSGMRCYITETGKQILTTDRGKK